MLSLHRTAPCVHAFALHGPSVPTRHRLPPPTKRHRSAHGLEPLIVVIRVIVLIINVVRLVAPWLLQRVQLGLHKALLRKQALHVHE